VRRRHRKWVESMSRKQVHFLWKQQSKEKKEESQLDNESLSMFRSVSIPIWVRLSMPIVILGNIGFFLSGHISLGASVSILASFGGQSFRQDGFFDFSMARSTIEIWNGKKNARINNLSRSDLTDAHCFVSPNSRRQGARAHYFRAIICVAVLEAVGHVRPVVCTSTRHFCIAPW
jgi:hypothetical protein